MGKSIGRFDPTPSRTLEECERHYTRVHVRMAQDLLRPVPSLLSYHTNRAVAQADVNGGWNQRPRAWRFVVLRFTPGATLVFTPQQNEMVAQDHVNCLYRLRQGDVDEHVLLDRLDRQLALAKFMIEADRAPGWTSKASGRLGYWKRRLESATSRPTSTMHAGARTPSACSRRRARCAIPRWPTLTWFASRSRRPLM